MRMKYPYRWMDDKPPNGASTNKNNERSASDPPHPFLLKPIFQFGSNTNSDARMSNRYPNQVYYTHKTTRNNSNYGRYRRRILNRIVTSLPDHISNEGECGEVEVCMEEYYHGNENEADLHSISTAGNSNELPRSPLLRRIAIRSYTGGHGSETRGNIHATFNLPLGNLPHSSLNSTSMTDTFSFVENNYSEISAKHNHPNGIYGRENWMCWATFGDSLSQHSQQSQGKNHSNQSHNKQILCTPSKSYLCVLSDPITLKVYHVYRCSNKFKSCTNTYHNRTQPNCTVRNSSLFIGDVQSVSLPFEACAIFSLPHPHLGILIQRSPTAMENITITPYSPSLFNSQVSMMNVDDGSKNSEEEDDDNDDPSLVIEGPPMNLRLGLNCKSSHYNSNSVKNTLELPRRCRLQPRPEKRIDTRSQPQNISSIRIETKPSSSTSSSIQGGSAIHAGTGHSIPDHIPSLYTLTHVLDDVRPCMFFQNNHYSPPDIHGHSMKQLFTNVHEKVLYVGSPRTSLAPPQNSNATTAIIVTYNTHFKRHALWGLNFEPEAPTPLPLWKQTSNALHGTKHLPNGHLGTQYNSSDHPGFWGLFLRDSSNDPIGQDFPLTPISPSSELHADVSLTCICDSLGKNSFDSVAENIFLATDSIGSGDHVLCLLLPISKEQKLGHVSTKNDFILRCFALETKFGNNTNTSKSPQKHSIDSHVHPNNAFWTISHLNDIPCQSAQPIFSTPLTLPLIPCIAASTYTNSSNHSQSQIPKKWWETKSGCPQSAIDILISTCEDVCATGDRNSKLKLFRANIHIVDCDILDSVPLTTDKTSCIKLCNPVMDRVDINFHSQFNCQDNVIRTSVSLVLKNSPVAEYSLLAVGSALSGYSLNTSPCYFSEIKNARKNPFQDLSYEERHNLLKLIFHIRADCARLTQFLSNQSTLPYHSPYVDDLEWYSLSSILLKFFDITLTEGASAGLENKVGKSRVCSDSMHDCQGNYTSWNSLLQSTFHKNYEKNNFHRGFLSDKLEENLEASNIQQKSSHACIDDYFINRKILDIIPSSFLWLGSINTSLEQYDSTDRSKQLAMNACTKIFEALHLLFEESKLTRNAKSDSWIESLGGFLIRICEMNSKSDTSLAYLHRCVYCDYYQFANGITPSIGRERSDSFDVSFTFPFQQPPNIFALIEDFWKATLHNKRYHVQPLKKQFHELEFLNGVSSSTNIMIKFISILDSRTRELGSYSANIEKFERDLVLAMVQDGILSPSDLQDRFSPGLIIPFIEILYKFKSNPPAPGSQDKWDVEAYNLIGRSDLMKIQKSFHLKPYDNKVFSSLNTKKRTEDSFYSSINDKDMDGLSILDKNSSMIFPHDNRIHEAARLLRTSRPSFLRVPRAVEVSDHDFERLKQDKLLMLCGRVLALPLGRGMLTIGSIDELPDEPLSIPPLCLAGRLPSTNATLALDISNCSSNMTIWPEFHNGVAAGLRLPMARMNGDKVNDTVTRTWIVYNKPSTVTPRSQMHNNASQTISSSNISQPNHSHGGFLMALGLRGHLSSLSMTDVYEYLTQGAITTTVGILLGLAANGRGSCDPSISKVLCLHIPSLLPPSFAQMDVATAAQAAAVAGIGLLYQGSSHRLMTEFLLDEIGKKPTNDQNVGDRESYNLALGIALGMVNLGCGEKSSRSKSKKFVNESTGLTDLHIEERLHRFIAGGKEYEVRKKRGSNFNQGGAFANNGESEICSKIFEGDMINTDLTAPGAMLALGLMHIQTGNKTVASMLALPDTHFLLDYVRSDFLLIRVVARMLVLWKDIEPTEEWIMNQIPLNIRQSYSLFGKAAEKSVGFTGLGTFSSMNLNGKLNKSGSDEIRKTNISINKLTRDNTGHLQVDRQAVRQAHAYIVTGSCFSLGLKFCGTGNKQALLVITNVIKDLLKLREESDPISLARKPKRQIIETCLGCAVISLSLVMAGTGDLDAFRLLRVVRWKCDDGVKYGNHMAFGAAIGLLFCGGGMCTLGREPDDIAALLISFFPHFPISSSDNQYHLQALRHCYALAIKRKKLEAVDVDTGLQVFAPMKIQLTHGRHLQLDTPCLLLNEHSITHIEIKSDRYFPSEIEVNKISKPMDNILLYVKKRSGHMSYMQDPHGLRSLAIQTGGISSRSVSELIKSFTEDSKLLTYVKYFCLPTEKYTTTNPDSLASYCRFDAPFTSSFCCDILQESLVGEKPEAISLYLLLYDLLRTIEKKCSPIDIWNLRLLRSYYTNRCLSKCSMLSVTFVALLFESCDNLLTLRDTAHSDKKRLDSRQQACLITWFHSED